MIHSETAIFTNLTAYAAYLGLETPEHHHLLVARFNEADHLRLQSPPIQADFYCLSLKYGFEEPPTSAVATPTADRTGAIYFSQPGQPIEWSVEKPWLGYHVMFSKHIVDTNPHLHFRFFSYSDHEALWLPADEDAILDKHFSQLYQAFKKEPVSEEVCVAYCHLIMTYVAQLYQQQFAARSPRTSRLLTQFEAALRDFYQLNAGTAPTVNYFAEKLSVTPSYLSDFLKKHTGKSILHHIHTHLIDVAKRQLTSSTYSVTEIAQQLGFTHPPYFTRLFQKRTGLTPSEYRKKK